jgi:hypothetical protein
LGRVRSFSGLRALLRASDFQGSFVMPRVRFTGRIFPTGVNLSVADHPQVNWHDEENNLDIRFTTTIQNNVVTVDCDVSRFDQTLITAIYMRAFDLARATVDLAAFSSGWAFVVVFETFTAPDGATTPIGAYDPSLATFCTAYQMGVKSTDVEENDFHKVLAIVSTDWRIFRALRHLIEAITLPHESATHCARAVEAMRHLIAPNEQPKKAWPKLRDALNVSEDYLKLITDVSTGPRHGDPTHIPGTTTTEITRRAWQIMNRFLEYKKRNSGPLPLAEFPLLIP